LDAACGSPPVGGEDERGATVPVHRLDNSGAKKCGRHPMSSCSSRKNTILVYFPINDLMSMQKNINIVTHLEKARINIFDARR
jgi:hypothetical protein